MPSTDPGNYRHFAVDNINTVLYFCDQSMHRAGLACYSSSDQGHSWTGIHHTLGVNRLEIKTCVAELRSLCLISWMMTVLGIVTIPRIVTIKE